MNTLKCLFLLVISFSFCCTQEELVYAEMEFPLSFVSQVRQYTFNPLARFQTEVEGRIIELTADPLVDIYQVTSGQQSYRSCLAQVQKIKLSERNVLNFNIENMYWEDNKKIGFDDIWFSLEYKKYNPDSWKANPSLTIVSESSNSLNAYYGDSNESPEPGEFYFPIVNRSSYINNDNPSKANVSKTKQMNMGYGRYQIENVEENRSIRMKRREKHPYYQNLEYPQNHVPVNNITMFSFPNARITRNEQFINGRVHLLTETLQTDVSYIVNTLGKENVDVLSYSDDSFSGFVLNCENPYLSPPAVRRALNYLIRKELMLKKALSGEGDIISHPLPKKNFFYNVKIKPYEDDVTKAMSILKLYRYWGLDVYNSNGSIVIYTSGDGPGKEFETGDIIQEVERESIDSLQKFLAEIEKHDEDIIRVKVINDNRVFVRRVQTKLSPSHEVWSSAHVVDDKIQGVSKLSLIANNPQGKNQLIKEICGALKEDLEKVGFEISIDYLDGDSYYPRLQKGDFDIAFRTLKLTGTPNLHRLFYHVKNEKEIDNVNYGRYHNNVINKMAVSTKNATEIEIVQEAWRSAARILHHDPPYIYLWSRNHIIMHDPKLKILSPGPQYKIPYGYTQINGLINIFNEVHLWALAPK